MPDLDESDNADSGHNDRKNSIPGNYEVPVYHMPDEPKFRIWFL
jgi:hypothetical protein